MYEPLDANLKKMIIETHSDIKYILRQLETINDQAINHEARIRSLELNIQTLKVKLVVLIGMICALATFLSHYVIARLSN